jgi:tetratricopeptide (TPR) repeat protein
MTSKLLSARVLLSKSCPKLQLSQQQYTEAIKALKQAIAYDSAFCRYHSHAIDISYHGMIIERLAELYLTNKQYTEAFASYQQALATDETAIQLAPVDFCNHGLKAGALASVADLHCSLSQYTQAVAYYQQAIACYNTLVEIKPLKANEFDKARVLQR